MQENNFRSKVEAVIEQLNFMHTERMLLSGRYDVLDSNQRCVGGQAVVQLVKRNRQTYAVKLYLDESAFETEKKFFETPRLWSILPAVDALEDNSETAVLGRTLPPMVVMEKGEPLNIWQRRCPADQIGAMHIVMHLAKRLAQVHKAGIVHRDLKPANIIHYEARNEWTLIDFGGGAQLGTVASPVYTLAYAAPEVVTAARGRRQMKVDVAIDAWALGVIAWELLTRTQIPVFAGLSIEQVDNLFQGAEHLPWEQASREQLQMLGFMKTGMLKLLARNPSKRATAADALQAWQATLNHQTTTVRSNSDDATLAASHDEVGNQCQALGEYSKALESRCTALEIRRKVLGEEHADTAASHHYVGVSLSALGRHADALQADQAAQEIRRKVLGEEHADTAASHHSVGLSLSALGRHADALQADQAALEIRRKVLGEEHADTAASHHSVGVTLHALGRHADALQAGQAALEIRRKVLGEEHTDTAASHHSVGVTLHALGRHADALQAFHAALECKVLGEEYADLHHSVGVTPHNLGRYADALQAMQTALEIRRKALGEEHADTAVSLHSVGVTLRALGRHADARKAEQKAKQIHAKLQGMRIG